MPAASSKSCKDEPGCLACGPRSGASTMYAHTTFGRKQGGTRTRSRSAHADGPCGHVTAMPPPPRRSPPRGTARRIAAAHRPLSRRGGAGKLYAEVSPLTSSTGDQTRRSPRSARSDVCANFCQLAPTPCAHAVAQRGRAPAHDGPASFRDRRSTHGATLDLTLLAPHLHAALSDGSHVALGQGGRPCAVSMAPQHLAPELGTWMRTTGTTKQGERSAAPAPAAATACARRGRRCGATARRAEHEAPVGRAGGL
jgi:hypothetical protein